MWEKRYEPKSGTVHVGECSPGVFTFLLKKQRNLEFVGQVGSRQNHFKKVS
jgi:hypothetical protein